MSCRPGLPGELAPKRPAVDRVSKETRSRMMSRVRSASSIERLPDTFRGLCLRRHPKGIFGSPDFANKSRRIAVFVDGCFWHGCPAHYRAPKSNRGFWAAKIRRNMRRDKLVTETLSKQGWTVVRVWECKLAQYKVGSPSWIRTNNLAAGPPTTNGTKCMWCQQGGLSA